MNLAYKYQNTFDDPLAEEFRQILSLPYRLKIPRILQAVLCGLMPPMLQPKTLPGKVLNWIDKTTGKDFAAQTTTNAPVPGVY